MISTASGRHKRGHKDAGFQCSEPRGMGWGVQAAPHSGVFCFRGCGVVGGVSEAKRIPLNSSCLHMLHGLKLGPFLREAGGVGKI